MIDGVIKNQIDKKPQQDCSSEQIKGYYGCIIQSPMASHETIYQCIYRDKTQGGDLYIHVRRKRKYRRNRTHTYNRRGQIPNRLSISDTPTIVDDKQRLRDFEGDLIVGKAHKGAVISLTDRKSTFTLLRFEHNKELRLVSSKIVSVLQPLNERGFHTLTLDNGLDFAAHQIISNKLGKKVYFAHPYSQWQRGCNENISGLARQYLPKGMEFSNLTP